MKGPMMKLVVISLSFFIACMVATIAVIITTFIVVMNSISKLPEIVADFFALGIVLSILLSVLAFKKLIII